jgi:hypothetical protein
MDDQSIVTIYQGGYDGFGHQFEGTLRLLSLAINKKALYFYDYNKTFRFEHSPRDSEILVNYILEGLKYLKNSDTSYKSFSIDDNMSVKNGDNRTFEDILARDVNYANTIYLYDGVGCGRCLPPNFEHIDEMGKSLPLLRCAFVTNNTYLPPPTYDKKYLNVCCHIRLGDAVGSRILDTENICNVIRHFQKQNQKYRVIIHSDEDVNYLQFDNTVIYNKSMDVINVFSDFIHADIFLMNYSSISIAAHLLADPSQVVICPDKAGVTFKHRILEKCITCSTILSTAI